MGLFDFFKKKNTGIMSQMASKPFKEGQSPMTNEQFLETLREVGNAQANGPLKKRITSEPGAYHHDTMLMGPIEIEPERLISIVTSAYNRGRMDVRDRNDGVDRGNNLENVLKDTMKEIGAIDSE